MLRTHLRVPLNFATHNGVVIVVDPRKLRSMLTFHQIALGGLQHTVGQPLLLRHRQD